MHASAHRTDPDTELVSLTVSRWRQTEFIEFIWKNIAPSLPPETQRKTSGQ